MSTHTNPDAAARSPGEGSKKLTDLQGSRVNKNTKYLVFTLADEPYGIPLSSVKEVIGLTEITPVPNSSSYFKGLINLRGKIISVIDFRAKLCLPQSEYEAKRTSIIITDVEDMVIGMIVDDVNEVIGFEADQIESELNLTRDVNRDYLTGVAKVQKKLILLVDIGKVLSTDDMISFRKFNKEAA